MVSDRQVRRLMKMLQRSKNLIIAAACAGGAHWHVYRLVTASYTKSIKLVLLKKAEDFLTTNGHE